MPRRSRSHARAAGAAPAGPSIGEQCTGYTPIEDYGAIGNLRTVALVSRTGSIDWLCAPDLDSPSIFAAILDHRRGGRFRVGAVDAMAGEQRYLPNTNILETSFRAAGRITVTDFMPVRAPLAGLAPDPAPAVIYRLVRCEGAPMEVEIEWSPRFDYARNRTKVDRLSDGAQAAGGGEQLVLGGLPSPPEIHDTPLGPVVRGRFRLQPGEQLPLVTGHGAASPPAGLEDCLSALRRSEAAWRDWVHQCGADSGCPFAGPAHGQVVRSGLALKLLTHRHTGAIAAAATTSLPEEIGGVRNWDYRYTWIRDAGMTAQALVSVGHQVEARDFLLWTEGVAEARGERAFGLQIMYGLHGERELPELELDHLDGYCGSRPVRIGNAAAEQVQLDIYGELLESAFELTRIGGAVTAELWGFLTQVADRAAAAWMEPDYGIWEVRGGKRHFVYSKLMVWVALDRAIRLAWKLGLPGNVDSWRRARGEVRAAILERGYDPDLGAFVQSFGSAELDASLLLMPMVDFLPATDPRVQGTIDRVLERLTENGLVYRYHADDGLPGGEGAFGLTTFWMIDALALSGRLDEARAMFEGVTARANHVGLYAEEFDTQSGAFLGNFPQAFSHVGFINSARYLAEAAGEHTAPAPMGTPEHRREG